VNPDAKVPTAWKLGVAAGAVVLVAIVAFALTRKKDDVAPPAASFNPVTADAAPPRASTNPLVAAAIDAGVTPLEMRNWRTRLDHELCSKAGEQFNKLDGRAPTDPRAINTVSLCLQYGNVAWYKCLLEATDIEAGKTCNRRFLQPPPP
jgi:hypothetical protein